MCCHAEGFCQAFVCCRADFGQCQSYHQMKYSISFNEYLAYSQPLTREEQQFLKEKKSLTYGIVAENAPFTSKNEQTGDDEGLTIDYIDIISQELNIPIYEKVVEAGDEPQALREEQIDITELFFRCKRQQQFMSFDTAGL